MNLKDKEDYRKKKVCKDMCEYLLGELESNPSIFETRNIQDFFIKDINLFVEVLTNYPDIVNNLLKFRSDDVPEEL